MKTVRRAAVGAAFVFIVLAGSASAALTSKHNSIRLEGTHGYRITFESSQAQIKRRTSGLVDVVAFKHHAFANYGAQGSFSSKSMTADFGKFGKVDVSFHPKKTTHPNPPPHCQGTVKKITGVWKGTMKFRGEKGYTKAQSTSAPGSHTVSTLSCGGGPDNDKFVSLSANRTSGNTSTNFGAIVKNKAGSKPRFSAFQSSFDGELAIFRGAQIKGKAKQFHHNQALDHAAVKPGAPFKGKGTFDSGNWSGDLRVKLPGAGIVPLTGPGFDAVLGIGIATAH